MGPTTRSNTDDPGEFRPLTPNERQLLWSLLRADFPGKVTLAEQVDHAVARTIDADGSLEFSVNGDKRAHVVGRIPVEAAAEDADGMTAHVLLHVLDGLLAELEVYREDGKPLMRPIDPASLRVIVP